MRYGVDTLPQKKKLGVHWGLVDKISPAFELRNSGVPAAVARSSRLSVPWVLTERSSSVPWVGRPPRTTDMLLSCSCSCSLAVGAACANGIKSPPRDTTPARPRAAASAQIILITCPYAIGVWASPAAAAHMGRGSVALRPLLIDCGPSGACVG
jgi:hypothetical protein